MHYRVVTCVKNIQKEEPVCGKCIENNGNICYGFPKKNNKNYVVIQDLNMEDLLTFEDAYNEAKEQGGKISVLLGNGFSMAYDARRFSFTNLLESAKTSGIIPEDSELSHLFANLQTSDFEKVIKTLEDGRLVTQIYQPLFDNEKINSDIKSLKKHLVAVITNNHPDKSTDIPERKSKKCAEFLDKFDRVYTLNYDLLAYWVILQNNLTKFTDGFGGGDEDFVTFTENQHELIFLHGALHIFDNFTETIKLTFARTGTLLKTQIYRKLLNDVYPVFISEGTSDEKLEKIRHNYYLNRCYKALRSQKGNLFVFGTMLKSNDEHIKQGIIKGKFTNLYIGVWSEAELVQAQLLKEEFETSGTDRINKKAILYNAKTVKPWG